MTERLRAIKLEIENLDKTFARMENIYPVHPEILPIDRKRVIEMAYNREMNSLSRNSLRKAIIKAIGNGEVYKKYHDVFIWGDQMLVPQDIIEKVSKSLLNEYGISLEMIATIAPKFEDDQMEEVETEIVHQLPAPVFEIIDDQGTFTDASDVPVRSISFTPEEVAKVVSDLLIEEYHSNIRGEEMICLKDHLTDSGMELIKKMAGFITDDIGEQQYLIESAMNGFGDIKELKSISEEIFRVRRQKIVDAFKDVHTGVIRELESSEYAKYFGYENALMGYNNIIQSITNPTMDWETLKPILKQYGMEEKMYIKDTYDSNKYLEILLQNRSYVRVIPIDRMSTRVEVVPNIDQVRLAWFQETDFVKGVFRNTPEFISTLSNTLTMYPLGFEYSPEGLKIPVVNK